MATPVPYNPTPQVAPQDRPVPYTQLNVPASAFGAATGEALSQQGAQLDKVGDELWARGAALQTLDQQARASEASAQFTTKLGELHADYTSKTGKAAIDGYQPYVDSVNQVRAQIRDSLGSPIAQRAYDQESRNMQSRAIWSAAGHAGQQNKVYLNSASQARMDSASNYALQNPEDDASFQAGLAKTKEEINNAAVLNGWSDDVKQQKMYEATSSLASSQIQGLAKSQPFTAKSRLEKYVKDGLITGADAGKLSDFIQKQQYTVGARKLSADIMAGADSQFGTGIVSPDRARDAISSVESSGSYNPPHPTITNPKSAYFGQHALGRYGIMQGNLQPWLKEAGMSPMSEQEFLLDHDAQDKLFDFKFGQYMEKTESFNAARKLWFGTGGSDGYTTQDQYQAKTDAALARSASRSDIDKVSRTAADKALPGDNQFADIVAQHSEMQHSRDMQIQLDDERRNTSTVVAGLGPKQDGSLPTSIEDLHLDPKVGAAYDALPLEKQNKVRNVLQANIKQGGYAFTEDSKKDYMAFVGSYNNPNRTPEDSEKLLDMDIMSQHWPWAEKQVALKMYGKLMERSAADPQMAHPLQVLDSMMSSADIDSKRDSTGHHKDEYNQFVGALHGVISDYMKENSKKPKDDEIKVMGSRLIQDLTKYRRSIFQPIQKFYQMDVPQDVQDGIRESYRKAYNAEPTDVEVHSAAVAAQYQKLYGRKPRASE